MKNKIFILLLLVIPVLVIFLFMVVSMFIILIEIWKMQYFDFLIVIIFTLFWIIILYKVFAGFCTFIDKVVKMYKSK